MSLADLTPGMTLVPAGHIASVVTYLEMTAPPMAADGAEELPPFTLVRLGAGELSRYRALFRAVGAPWLWFSRLRMGDELLRAVLGDRQVEAYAVCDGAEDIGLLELDFRVPGECELAFLGLVADRVGRGTGRWLMREALQRAWRPAVRRVHVHTCTLDHPQAVAFYMRSGFTPVRRAVEVAPDPRLTGDLPPTAAPHAPLIANGGAP